MKKTKLKIENFLNNELINQTKIVGGGGDLGSGGDLGGPAGSSGNGGGDVDPSLAPIGIGNPPPKSDPNKM
jgi:hypothetical protein